MLAEAGIISAADRDELLNGLDRVADELDSGAFDFRPDDEDIHMAIERRLTEIVGPVGGKLHTARSRNDQVATDMAMFTRAHALGTVERLQHLQSALVQLADRHLDWAMPGYTHLQRAQPVYLAHHLLAYFWMFRRDARRFEHVLGATSDLPLGAGALAGVNFETDDETSTWRSARYEIVARSAASCTPRARATTRSRPTWRCSRARTRSGPSSGCRACRARSSSSPTATSTGRCPATRTSSARSPSTSPTTCSPTSGCSGATRGGSSTCSARPPTSRSAPARSRA